VTNPPPSLDHGWRRLAVAIYLPTALSTLGLGAIAPLVALSARALGASVAEAAFIVALLGLGGLVGALPAGVLAARVGERRALVGAMLLDAVAFGVAAVAGHVALLGAAVFVAGMSGAVLLLARQTYLTEAVPYRFRARALSTLGGVFRLGATAGPLLGAGAVAIAGLPAAWVLAGALSVLGAVVTLRLPDLPAHPAAASDEPVRLGRVLREHARTYRTLGLGAAALMLVRAGRDALIPLWCEANGLDATATSLVFALGSAVDLLLFYLGGSLMDRHGRRNVAVPALLVMGTGFALLPLASSAAAIAAVAVLLGLGNGISSGVVMTLGSDASPRVGRAQFLAGWRLTTGLGQSGGPVLVAAVSAVAPLGAAAFAVAGVGVVGAAWLWHWASPRRLPDPAG